MSARIIAVSAPPGGGESAVAGALAERLGQRLSNMMHMTL